MFNRTLIAATLALATMAQAQSLPPLDPPLTVKPLRDGVYWVSGGVANSAFVVGDKGVVVVDTQLFVEGARSLQAEIANITPKPVGAVILTHSDPDHVLGLPAFPAHITIVAQRNARDEIKADSENPQSRPAARAMKDVLPNKIVQHRDQLVLEGVRMTLIHTAGAHTDGDLALYLPRQKIVIAGDLLTPGIGDYPGIHLCKHGSSLGWIASVEAILALDADVYVSGHGGTLTRAEVKARIDAARRRRAQVAALVAQHKSLDEIKTLLGDQPLGGDAAAFPTYVETTYQELTNTAPCGNAAAPAHSH